MDPTIVNREIILAAECPAIHRKVILYKQTWEEHILPARPDLKHRLGLVREIIEKSSPGVMIYQKIDNPDRISFQKESQHFLPYNKYLRIALKLLSNSKTAIVTTVVPVNKLPTIGVKKYERK